MVSVTFHNSVCTFIPAYNHLHDALINQKKICYQVCCEKPINWTRFHQNGLVCLEMQNWCHDNKFYKHKASNNTCI